MSLILDRSKPQGLEAKTYGCGMGNAIKNDVVYIGDYEIPEEDFFVLAHYVLTNTNLRGDDDPRLQFVESVRAMAVIDGFPVIWQGEEVSTKRLDTEVSPVPEPSGTAA